MNYKEETVRVELAIRRGKWGVSRRYRVTIFKDRECRISRELYVVNCKEGFMVALVLSLLAQVGIPGTWIAFRFRPADATSLRETRTTGPWAVAKSKTELGDGKVLRQMRVNRSGLFGGSPALIRQMRAPWLGRWPLEKWKTGASFRSGQAKVLIGVLDFSRRPTPGTETSLAPSAAGQRGRHLRHVG
ncbi:hypothetical protein NA56DRAFT_722530 [Hyaloscypha hepaticicola]|uniref:Uncharacterized protein n=1 Tax=Hyaloscypha hepaticicola TaxID=2082293 RepID=A0A2J6Q2T4_9HELO|nr:hypothetical protein NA56DRAFT_722530 [Hyaloscypha hepaticicola]